MLLAVFCYCTDRFVSDLVGNPEDRFSRVTAQLLNFNENLGYAVNSAIH